jgi:hypothetical protein
VKRDSRAVVALLFALAAACSQSGGGGAENGGGSGGAGARGGSGAGGMGGIAGCSVRLPECHCQLAPDGVLSCQDGKWVCTCPSPGNGGTGGGEAAGRGGGAAGNGASGGAGHGGSGGAPGVMCGADRCEAGQVCCTACDGSKSCGQACLGVACPADGGDGACSSLTTLAACDARSDCHAVFDDPGTCGCASAGCCAHFSKCADGGKAVCTMPSTFGCTIHVPFCESPYVVGYTAACYEGCVRASACP